MRRPDSIRWLLPATFLVAAACAPLPATYRPSPPIGTGYRLLATDELPIVGITVDSQAAGFPKERLADGDLATQWSSGVYRAPSAWVVVDLPGVAMLTSLAIKTGPSKAGTGYDVQVSEDGGAWTSVLTNRTNTTWGLETKPLPAGVRGRRLRVLWHNSPTAPDARFSVFELVVRGEPISETSPEPSPTPEATPTPVPSPTASPVPTPTPTPTPTPIASDPGMPVRLRPSSVSAGSSYLGLAPQRAVDGDAATQWGSDRYRAPEEWLALSFETPSSFEQVRIKTGALPAGVSYRIEVSDDGSAWRAASDQLSNSTWGLEPKNVTGSGRHLRVRFANNPAAPTNRFYIFELEVLGQALAVTPPSATPSPTPTPTPLPSATPTPAQSAWPGAPTPHRRLSPPGSAIASSGTAELAVDGQPGTAWSPSSGLPQAIAVPLLDHPLEPTLLVCWDSTGYHYTNTAAAPTSYEIHTSLDSSDGRDGTWTLARRVTDNPLRSRIDTIAAPGARWLRLVTNRVGAFGPQLRELAVYGTTADQRLNAWLLLGDSITAQSFDPSRGNLFGATVEARLPGHAPLLVAGGTGGDTAELGRQKLAQGLELSPPGSFVGLAFGTNDATQAVPIETFQAHVQSMIDAIRASGRTPMLARPPWNLNGTLPRYVAAIDELTRANDLAPGPDLYEHFRTHPEQLRDDRVHPTAEGEQAIQRLWGEAVARAYAR